MRDRMSVSSLQYSTILEGLAMSQRRGAGQSRADNDQGEQLHNRQVPVPS